MIRHGKSSWESTETHDLHRPLLPKGIRRSEAVAEYMLSRGAKFDLILSSHAVRAKETANIVAGIIGYPEEDIRIVEDIYLASEDTLEELLLSLDDKIQSVAIFGHNPGMTYFVSKYLDTPIANFPTSGVACFKAICDSWTELPLSPCEEDFYITPKILRI